MQRRAVSLTCPLAAVPPGSALRLDGPVPVAVFNVAGAVYAIDDTCTHQDASLADGWVEDCHVECPLHASTFDLRTGECTGPPAKRPVRTHPVTIAAGIVRVDVVVTTP
ncbi:MAG: 3-phenylpropionate dioxygenase [Frankiales bacterium]|jgi:3-phenylpropionate/trans-cinnamate dioxygenase ferredoxin subunit|nr:3-phenylpropionate dioxygenase [Frankiales bacterium]